MTLRDRSRGISLGIFAGDLCNLHNEARKAEAWGCGILHFDIMDGVFVPQMIGGPGFVNCLAGNSILDVHLMVQHPANHVTSYVSAGADIITVHAESENSIGAISAIRNAAGTADRDVLVGVSLMPGTSLEDAQQVLAMKPDLILVLALDPRNDDGADVSSACARVFEIRERFPEALISFDGGVTEHSMPEIMASAPDIVVSGSAVMKSTDPRKTYERMSSQM